MGQRSPFQSEVVPLDYLERGEKGQHDHHREEPAGVHQPLGALPVAMHEGAIEEEGEVTEHLHQAGVVEEFVGLALISQCPGEMTWQVAGLEQAEGDDEEEKD